MGKSELFNFKCYNKASVVETKETSIENTNLKSSARAVGPHTLPLGHQEVTERTLCEFWTLLGCTPLDCLCHKSSGLMLTCKFSMFLHPMESYLRFPCIFTF